MTQEEIEKYCEENDAKIIQYVSWLNYQIGFSGVGTTALDIKPDFDMPTDIPDDVKKELIESGKEWARHKWECWCESVKETLGEETCGEWECPKIG